MWIISDSVSLIHRPNEFDPKILERCLVVLLISPVQLAHLVESYVANLWSNLVSVASVIWRMPGTHSVLFLVVTLTRIWIHLNREYILFDRYAWIYIRSMRIRKSITMVWILARTFWSKYPIQSWNDQPFMYTDLLVNSGDRHSFISGLIVVFPGNMCSIWLHKFIGYTNTGALFWAYSFEIVNNPNHRMCDCNRPDKLSVNEVPVLSTKIDLWIRPLKFPSTHLAWPMPLKIGP